MNVVRQDNGSGMRLFQDPAGDHAWSGPLPIERVDVPNDDPITEFVMDPTLLIRRDVAIGRAQQRWPLADGRGDGVVRFLQLVPDRFIRHFREVGMRPGMVRDLVSLARRAPENLGMVRRVLPDDKKCRFEMMSREEVEQFRSERRVGAIVEGKSDVRAFDVDGIKRDLWLGRRGCHRHNRIGARNRRGRRRALPGSDLGKNETERGIKKQPSGKHVMAKKREQKTFGVSSRGDLQRKPRRGPIFHG
jgi:hypothetical protein